MDGISVYSEDTRTTLVPNEFIDYYMPHANGTFVKVYIYLLRCLTAPSADFGISVIADALDETEKDILRALRYWEKENVLSLTWGTNNEIRGIKLHRLARPTDELATGYAPASATSAAPAFPATDTALDNFGKKPASDKLPDYTPAQLDAFANREDTNWLLHVAESYLERMLKPADIQLVFYLHDELDFSSELILHLYEYCVSRGKKTPAYIQKVALSWHEEGIRTAEEAERHSLQYDACYSAVKRAFGLNRDPGSAEVRYVRRWSSYGFSSELIEEACSRALLATSRVDFKYTDKIMERWHQNDVHTMSDIKKLDEAHSARSGKRQSGGGTASPQNGFNAFPQRDYSDNDLNDLETTLLSVPADH